MTTLAKFAKSVNDHAELFAGPSSSSQAAELEAQALSVVRSLLDPHLASEQTTLPMYQEMIQTIGSAKPVTRSAAKRKDEKLEATPLSEIYIPPQSEQADELVWQQMCLRLDTLQNVLGKVLGRPMELGEEAASDPELEDGQGGQQIDEDDSGSDEDSQEDVEEASEAESDSPSQASSLDAAEAQELTQPLNRLTSSSPPPEEPLLAPKKRKGKPSPVDDTFFNLQDFLSQSDAGEAEMAKRLQAQDQDESSDEEDEEDVDLFAPLDEDDEDLQGEDLADVDNVTYNDFFAPPASTSAPSKHAPKPSTSATKTPAASSSADDNTLKRKRSVRFNDVVRVKPIRSRKIAPSEDEGSLFQRLLAGGPITEDDLQERERLGVDPSELLEENGEDDDSNDEFDESQGDDLDALDAEQAEDDEGDDDEDEDDDGMDVDADGPSFEDEDDGESTMDRLKSDLFDDDSQESDGSDADAEDPNLSRYERRQRALSRQISQLEEENVGKKDWVLSGEARAKDRPLNSLLEEDLEYEHTGKSTPTITTESVASLEERIKQRILGNDWDDVERRLPVDIAKMVPGRLMDVSAEPGKSLAEVFEAQHMAAIGQAEDLDEPTKKKHQEITELFDSICLKLDALSNARYTPKAPQTSIQSTSNVSAVSMEDAQPTSTSAGTLLAPEEVYKGKASNASKTEMDSSEKKSVRRKNRRARAGTQRRVQELVDQRDGGKDKARKELIGHRGVTVLGKPGQKKGGKLDKNSQKVQSGQSFKL